MAWATLPCAAIYCLLLCLLGDSIEAAATLESTLGVSTGEGPATLFAINSGIMGWASVTVLRKKLGITGSTVFALGLIHWGIAITAGLTAAWLINGSLPVDPAELGTMCGLCAALAGGFNAFMPEEL